MPQSEREINLKDCSFFFFLKRLLGRQRVSLKSPAKSINSVRFSNQEVLIVPTALKQLQHV